MPLTVPAQGVQPEDLVYANALSAGLRAGKYMLFDRPPAPAIFNAAGVGAVYGANAAEIDGILVPGAVGNNFLELYQTTAQAIPPLYNAKGLLIGGDAIDNESLELVPGGNRAECPLGYLAGTDPGVFIRATLEITDVSEYDQLVVGFRKQEPYQVPTSFLTTGDALYTDFAGIGFSGTAVANLVKTMNDLANAGSTTVFSTTFAWADTKVHQLEVRVRARRVEYLINGRRLGEPVKFDALGVAITSQPTLAPPTFTFAAATFLIPFIFVRRGASSAAPLYLRRLEVGQLLEIGLQPEGR